MSWARRLARNWSVAGIRARIALQKGTRQEGAGHAVQGVMVMYFGPNANVAITQGTRTNKEIGAHKQACSMGLGQAIAFASHKLHYK